MHQEPLGAIQYKPIVILLFPLAFLLMARSKYFERTSRFSAEGDVE